MINADKKDDFVNTIVKSSNCILLLVLPITVGAIVLAEPIVRILFQRGAFDAESTNMTYNALRLYSIGLAAMGIREVITRVFYSLSDTKTPMINASIALIMNIIMNLILIKPFGYRGLAISTSIASIITVMLLFRSLKKRTGYFGGDKIIKVGIKSLVSSVIMGVCTVFVYKGMYGILGAGMINELLSLVCSVVVSVVVYFILIMMLKVDEMSLVLDMLDKAKAKFLKR